jgi:Ulp1 family protease
VYTRLTATAAVTAAAAVAALTSPSYDSAKRYLRKNKVDLHQLDRLIVPINPGEAHWAVLVLNIKMQRMQYYDRYDCTQYFDMHLT